MEVIRWIIGIILISASFWVLIVNWMALVLSIISQRFHSQVPLCGALLGIGGLLLMPIKMPYLFFLFFAGRIGLRNYYVRRLGSICGL